jgi:hypothetical protein
VGADAERLEARDQRVLPRQQLLDVEAAPGAVGDGGGRDHEVLRATRAQALPQPENPDLSAVSAPASL